MSNRTISQNCSQLNFCSGIFDIFATNGTIILLNAEFNAHPSQAEVASGIFNAVQSDRLAFMLEMTKK
ncbi:MAG: hypothetical protein KME52_23020 [Desmonostoc geniculatum HA4340-LM1]|nr:hypothetical protein [Desmonostoc geniculatum HA4340-LM1]